MSDQNVPAEVPEEPKFELPPAEPEPSAPLEAPQFELPATPPAPAAAPSSAEITSDDKLWALLAYVLSPVVPIIIALMEDKKNRPFLKSHNMQALVAGVAAVVILIVLGIIPLVQCVTPIVGLAFWALLIYWGIQAYGGKTVTIPFITDFVKQQGWA